MGTDRVPERPLVCSARLSLAAETSADDRCRSVSRGAGGILSWGAGAGGILRGVGYPVWGPGQLQDALLEVRSG